MDIETQNTKDKRTCDLKTNYQDSDPAKNPCNRPVSPFPSRWGKNLVGRMKTQPTNEETYHPSVNYIFRDNCENKNNNYKVECEQSDTWEDYSYLKGDSYIVDLISKDPC